jgi:Leucine-rich repeat (LRR) protein
LIEKKLEDNSMKKIVSILLLVLSISFGALAQREQDSLALVALYNATNGTNWSDKTNWLSSKPINTWYGVFIKDNRVAALSFYNNNLNGTIPPQIGNLTKLENIYFRGNNLSGAIPPQIGNLANLIILDLDDNKLTGTIPPEIGNLTNLETLWLYFNQLSGVIPPEIGNLTKLKYLILQTNQISGTIPKQIGNLSNLEELNFGYNKLEGIIPKELGNLAMLKILSLFDNKLSGELPSELGQLGNLGILNLVNNSLSGSLPSTLSNLSKLTRLNLYNNKFTGLADLSGLTLSSISVQNNLLDFSALASARIDWTKIQYYFYSPQNLQLPVNRSVSGTDLILTVDYTYPGSSYQWYKEGEIIQGETGNSLKISTNDLSIYYCLVTNPAFPNLNLESVKIGSEHGGVSLADSLALVSLYNSAGGTNWINKTNWLSAEPISSWFGVKTYMGKVTELNLNYNNLIGTLPSEIGNLTKLTKLDLSVNRLIGTLPIEIGNLIYLSYLTLSYNLLSGPIPAEIGNLTNLTYLDLCSNNLTGNVPSAIGNLTKLNSLFLQTNRLSGLSNLSGLTSLFVIWLSDNLLDFANLAAAQIPSTKPNYVYGPQNYRIMVVTSTVGTDIKFSLDYSHPGTTFQWFKDNISISGETNSSLTVSNSDPGLFMCKVKHPDFPSLELSSYNVSTTQRGVLLTDSLALVNFYYSTGGPGWKIRNWLNSNPVSTWYGVTVTNNRVTSIVLNNNSLLGTIPPEIGNLSKLSNLTLGTNKLTGSLPKELFTLAELTHLDLHDNQLSGSIPSMIGNLTALDYLSLDRNKLTGSIPAEIGNLTNLIYLALSSNQLTGSIPEQIGSLTKLNTLYLYTNNLSGTIPKEICNLNNLLYLTFGTNQLSGSIPSEMGNLTNLISLNLSGNQLSGAIPSEVGNLTKLTSLSLYSNQLSGNIPPQVGNLTKLTSLALYLNKLSGTIPPQIGNLTELRNLHLYNNQLSGSIPSEIGNLTSLIYLYLQNNQLSGTIPSQIGNLTNLIYLYLFSNQLTGTIPAETGNLSKLAGMVLYNNQLSGAIPSQLGNLTNLTTLSLYSNQLSGTIPPEIGNLTKLTYLGLGNNKLSGELPAEIGNLVNMDFLSLFSNQFTGSVPSSINNLTKMKRMKINDNRFDGLPILTLAALDSLRIYGNRFTFEDIESNIAVPKISFMYSPQDSIGTQNDFLRSAGEDISFNVSVGGANNQYQWYKDNLLIPSATSSTLSISDLQYSDNGSYICAITNTIVPGLTIFSRTQNLTVSGPTDINSDNLFGIKIYPNPTQGYLNIDINSEFGVDYRLDISDLQGRIVYRKNIETRLKHELDLTSLPKGMYFIKIHLNNKVHVQKLMIQ